MLYNFWYICLGAVRRHDEMKSYLEHLELRPGHTEARVGYRLKERFDSSADRFSEIAKVLLKTQTKSPALKVQSLLNQIFLFTMYLSPLKNILVLYVKIMSLIKFSLCHIF